MERDELYRIAERKIEIARRTQVTELDLSNIKLTQLPESLGQFTQLQWLNLSNNELAALPESLGQLTQLLSLNLSNNELTALPESLRQLPRLEALYLRGNDALGIPTEILGSNPTSILKYYFSTRGTQGRALRELKLIVVGRGGAGKTSLIRRLNGEPLDLDESETHGINISPLTLDCDDGRVTAQPATRMGQMLAGLRTRWRALPGRPQTDSRRSEASDRESEGSTQSERPLRSRTSWISARRAPKVFRARVSKSATGSAAATTPSRNPAAPSSPTARCCASVGPKGQCFVKA